MGFATSARTGSAVPIPERLSFDIPISALFLFGFHPPDADKTLNVGSTGAQNILIDREGLPNL
jgi:hypothetical protein